MSSPEQMTPEAVLESITLEIRELLSKRHALEAALAQTFTPGMADEDIDEKALQSALTDIRNLRLAVEAATIRLTQALHIDRSKLEEPAINALGRLDINRTLRARAAARASS